MMTSEPAESSIWPAWIVMLLFRMALAWVKSIASPSAFSIERLNNHHSLTIGSIVAANAIAEPTRPMPTILSFKGLLPDGLCGSESTQKVRSSCEG